MSRTYDVLILPEIFENVPQNLREHFKEEIKSLKTPFPEEGHGNKKEIKGATDVAYRLRIGDYRAFYRIDSDEHIVYVFEILTAEQAHKKYGRL